VPRGGELIREARLRAGLTQKQLSELSGRERSVIARWEQGAISPPIDSLMEIIHACGFDLPLTLMEVDKRADQELREALMATPSERLQWLLGQMRAKRGARGKSVAGRASAVFDPFELLGALQARNVNLVVIGAFARVVRGTRELTDGIDITPSTREENLGRLEQALEDLDARRADRAAFDLRNLEEPLVELETRAGVLKLVPEPAGTRGYDDLRRRADREPLGRGLRPQIASTDDLARMLGAFDRDQDLERLLRLRRLMNLEHDLNDELGRNRDIEPRPARQ
jgi:transcriptional regulator with XRE-family HTH domain